MGTSEEKKIRNRQYYLANKQRLLEHTKEYRQAHRKEYNEWQRNRYHQDIDNASITYHKSVNTDRARKYRQTEAGKAATRAAVKRYEKKNQERRKAWMLAQSIEKKPCEVCQEPNTHRHHPDITKPLEVVFLCPKHHKEADAGIKSP